MRVETERGEATVIVDSGIVEHVSPAMCWALGMPLETLKRRLADLEWVTRMIEVGMEKSSGFRRVIRPIRRQGRRNGDF